MNMIHHDRIYISEGSDAKEQAKECDICLQ